MDANFKLTRHTALWEEKNLQVKRTIIASLVLCVLLLMNVLKPYSSDLDKRKKISAEIETYKIETSKIESDISAIDDFKKILSTVQTTIQRQPWMKEKDKLIRTLADLRHRGQGNWDNYQAEADQTVKNIEAQVHDLVVTPLNAYLLNDPRIARLMPELSAEVKTLPVTLKEWTHQNLGKRWYRTLESKTDRVETLSRNFEPKLLAISNKITQEKPNLVEKKTALKQAISSLEKKSDIKAKKELMKTLEARMDKILPEWLRGLISVHQMIQLYPVIILGLVIYVMLISLSLNSHYQAMADIRKITAEEKKDPVFSSLWTLTFRGHLPTFSTIVAYISFVAVMWALFETGADILSQWLIQENTGFMDQGHLDIIQWTGRLLLSAAICFYLIKPYSRKTQDNTSTN